MVIKTNKVNLDECLDLIGDFAEATHDLILIEQAKLRSEGDHERLFSAKGSSYARADRGFRDAYAPQVEKFLSTLQKYEQIKSTLLEMLPEAADFINLNQAKRLKAFSRV